MRGLSVRRQIANRLTVADSQCLDPISVIDGGRRYSFNNEGAECALFVNNYARKGRHDFVFGSTVPGPNTFVHGTADTAYADSGPHHRWSVGGLFDLVTVNGDEINVRNRGNSGTGHGWAGAYMAVWNCKADSFSVRNPPTARNWLVGSTGTIATSSGFAVGADPPGTYDSSGPSGAGKAVSPRSLYYGQLQQRMKWPASEFREVWLGDVDQHSSTGNAGEAVNCDPTWLTQVEAIDALPASPKFDELLDNRHIACTLDFPLDPGDTVVAASLTVSLRAIGSAATDTILLDSTTSPQTFSSLGWTPVSTSAPTVRTMELSPALLNDGRLNLAFGTNSAVDFVALHLQVQKAQPSTQTLTLNPVADAYVMGGVNIGTNYGTATNLITKDDASADFDRETFLRWDLSGVSGKIVQAKVRLAGITIGQTGNENCAAFVNDDNWSETAINFTNKPAAGKLFAQWLPVAGQPVEFAVTPQVVETLLGDDKLSLSILSTGTYGSNGIVNYASRENATVADRPQLILTIDNSSPTISDVADQIVNEDTATAALPVILGGDLPQTLGGTSSNTTLVPNANIVFGGSGVNRTVTVTPAAHQSGTTTITLSTTNGTLTATDTFTLTVNAVGDAAIKAATGSALNLASAWTGVFVPVDPDTATWNATSLAGTLTLGANLSWAGLIVNDPAGSLTVNGTQTLTLGSGGIDLSASTVNLTLNHPVILGSNQTWNVGPGRTLAASSQVSGSGYLTKIGSGTLVLSGLNATAANNYTGTTTIGEGTLAISVIAPSFTGGLTFGSANAGATLGNLDFNNSSATFAGAALVRTNSASANTVSIGPSRNLVLDGGLTLGCDASGGTGQANSRLAATGLGSIAVNGATISIGLNQAAVNAAYSSRGTLDISGLAAFSTNVSNFYMGALGNNTHGPGDAILSNTSNTILATTLTVGDTGSNNGNGTSTLTLGTGANLIQADTIRIGRNKGSGPGIVKFASQTAGSSGTVAVGGKSGNSRSNIDIANQLANATAVGAIGTLDLRGHPAMVSAGTVTIGSAAAGSNTGSPNGTLAFDAGSFDVNTLILAPKSGAGTGTSRATVNIGGGSFTVNTAFTLGSQATGGFSIATMNLTGGALISNVDITQGGGATTSTLNLDGPPATTTLNLNGKAIGTLANPVNFNARQGTLQNIASINGTGGLTKTTIGTLVLSGTNSYAGATVVNEGILTLGASNAIPSTAVSIGNATLNAATFTGTLGTLDVTSSAAINFGAGGSLSFANSSGIDWSGGTVNLTGTFVSGSSLRFGTTSSGLTSTQLGKISATGFTGFALNGSGYLTATPAGFSSWITGTFTNGLVPVNQRGSNDDPDNDGIRNLVEYAIAGQDPTVANATVGTFTGTTLSFTKRPGTSGLTYAIQKSTDLGLTDVWAEFPPGGSYINDATTISYSSTPPTPVKNFLRLRVLAD